MSSYINTVLYLVS